MPRIRTIKPEFWVDEKVVELDPWARLLFIGLWNFADDQGYLEYSVKRIKMQIFPGDTVDVSPLLASLLEAGLLAAYDSPIGKVLHIQSWEKHQKVSNAATPRVNPDELRSLNLSPDPPTEPSRDLASPLSGKERKGREGERKGKEHTSPPAPTTLMKSANLFDEFWEIYPRREAKAVARKAWDRALGRASPEKILTAAAAYRDLPGRNPQYTKMPATWLNQDCWLDERPPPSNVVALHGQRQPTPGEANVAEWLSVQMPIEEGYA